MVPAISRSGQEGRGKWNTDSGVQRAAFSTGRPKEDVL